MKLDPDHVLSPATIEAIRDILPPRPSSTIDDSTLLQLALGVADKEARLACARAILASPEVGARLMRIRARIREEIGGGPGIEDRADLGRLSVFPGRFSLQAATAVFPDAFVSVETIRRLADRGWLEFADQRFAIPDRVRELVSPPEDDDWQFRFVSHYAAVATSIDRTMAEGHWVDALATLKNELLSLRKAWKIADALAMAEIVESMTRSLLVGVFELGARLEFDELVAVGYRAAEIPAQRRFRSWLLSYEGVSAVRDEDFDRAVALWTERARLAASMGWTVSQADAMLDLAALAYTRGDAQASERLLDQAEPVVMACGRRDFAANLHAARAINALRLFGNEKAVRHAERALELLTGVDGVDFGLFVRTSAATVLIAAGQPWRAATTLTEALELAVEGGRSVPAASVLAELAVVLEAHGLLELAARCLDLSLAIHRRLGTNAIDPAVKALSTFRSRHPGFVPEPAECENWAEASSFLLGEIENLRVAAERGR